LRAAKLVVPHDGIGSSSRQLQEEVVGDIFEGMMAEPTIRADQRTMVE
jgi:hypothetical protein